MEKETPIDSNTQVIHVQNSVTLIHCARNNKVEVGFIGLRRLAVGISARRSLNVAYKRVGREMTSS